MNAADLMNEHKGYIRKRIKQELGSDHPHADEVFGRLWEVLERDIRRGYPIDPILGYLSRAIRNCAVDMIRRDQAQTSDVTLASDLTEDDESNVFEEVIAVGTDDGPEAAYELAEIDRRADAALAKLPEASREAARAILREGMTYPEAKRKTSSRAPQRTLERHVRKARRDIISGEGKMLTDAPPEIATAFARNMTAEEAAAEFGLPRETVRHFIARENQKRRAKACRILDEIPDRILTAYQVGETAYCGRRL